jgi:hypothetical protein
MSATPEQQAPGCFGAASTYSTDSAVCRACVAYQACGQVAYERLQALREIVNIKDLLAQHENARRKAQLATPTPSHPMVTSPIPVTQPNVAAIVERTTPVAKVAYAVSVEDQRVIDALGAKSVKAKEAAATLCRNNRVNDMRAMLPRGQNPFAKGGPQYLRIVCDMLLRGGLTKAQYKARLVKELDWADGTAGSHVAVGCALLYSFGIMVQDPQERFVLNPALRCDNKTST